MSKDEMKSNCEKRGEAGERSSENRARRRMSSEYEEEEGRRVSENPVSARCYSAREKSQVPRMQRVEKE